MNELTDIFKIISDETRLRILVLLYREEFAVCQLSVILELPQPKVSQALSKLRDLGCVIDNRKEKFVLYSIKKEFLIKLLELLSNSIERYPQLFNVRYNVHQNVLST